MALLLLRRGTTTFTPLVNSHFISRVLGVSTRASTLIDTQNGASQLPSVTDKGIGSIDDRGGLHISPLFTHTHGGAHLESCEIELVDAEAWRISSSLVEAWRGTDRESGRKVLVMKEVDEVDSSPGSNQDGPDLDEIEDMRIRGNLFYKLDRDSKEFEEYSFDFHRKKSWKNENNRKDSKTTKTSNSKLARGDEESLKNNDERRESRMEENSFHNLAYGGKEPHKLDKNDAHISSSREMGSYGVAKKARTPTFNQLTGPYHEPFCLDIYISKGSVRACVIHRATSKVVAVAHSISKDMKFDLSSTKNASACAAVGEVLAQRALADDIHNVLYTPRKGEKLEGKLQIVLQSIIDNGVVVKVKIKQRRVKKASATG